MLSGSNNHNLYLILFSYLYNNNITILFNFSGAKVLLACRDLVKAQEAISDIKSSCNKPEKVGHLRMIKLDLSSITSVRNCVDEVFASEERLDILVNNGGVVGPKEQTEDGFEKTFATNYLGHFLLTLLLLPLLEKSEAARIVSVSSLIHYRKFNLNTARKE